MTFAPVIHPGILIPLGLAALAVSILALVRARGRRVRWALRVLLVLACVAALLRPGLPGGRVEVLAENADVFILVDTSASIVAEDWGEGKPRLEGVREDVQAIADRYPGARFSLITFDSTTSVRLPLTTDSTALMSALAVLSPEVTDRSSGSSVTQASSVLRQLLGAAAESGQDRARLVFYLGDGEQTAAQEPGSFSDSRKYVGAGLVLGYGTEEGGPMRITSADPAAGGEEYIQYRGEDARSVIDEENLQRIADQLEIGYAHRSEGAKLELPDAPATTTRNATGEVGAVIELYWIPAALAAALLAFEVALAAAAATRVGRFAGKERGRSAEERDRSRGGVA